MEHHLSQTDPLYLYLERRLGRAYLTQRLETERRFVARVFGHGLTFFHIENMHWFHWVLRLGLRMTGLYWWGQRNAKRIGVRRNRLTLAGLPPAFEGFTILQLSDLHLDLNPGITDAVIDMAQATPCDLCVITGDFRSRTWGPSDRMLREMARLRPALRGDVYAVLGNHDFIETVPPLEELGMRLLLNEAVALRRDGDVIFLAGIDDAHYYETDNIQRAAAHLDHPAPAILLSHTPETFRKAAACGFGAMLCGHTHGGQLCAPGGIPFIINARIPLRLVRGRWRYRNMEGYTSTGTGCAGLDVRFWCPPEITVHTLTGHVSEAEPRTPPPSSR
jgi:predicted MPP superfamily phosphohydrolase